MGGGEGSKTQYKHEEGEAGGSLEPDPRYGRCCSSVCRPGYALRDALLGLLVLLGLAVVVTVIFVVCFYVLPDEKHLIEEGLLASTAEGIIREPVEVNEISLSDGDAYNVVPNDPKKSTVGRSQDFNTFSTTANFEDTTTQLSSADASQFTVFQDASDVVAPSRGHGNKPGVPRRENLDQDNFHEHQKGQNDGEHRQNLGHKGERPVLEGEDDQFQGAGSRNTEEVNFFEDTSPKAACGAVQLPMCTAAVPWSSAGRPNWLGHSADEAIFASLTAVRHLLVESRCSPLASLYACSILEPPCKDDMILPPCRNFCLEVSRSCQVPASSGIAAMFECEKFPDSTDPNVCVSAQEELLQFTNTATNVNSGPDIAPENFQPPQNEPALQLDQEAVQFQATVISDSDHGIEESSLPGPVEITDTEQEEDGLAICTMDMFMCLDGSDCLTHNYVCDGVQNCVDYSDEVNCTNTSPECSGEDDFQCATTGLCVPSSWLCDGADDCRDNSDEQNCPLRRAGFGPVTNVETVEHPEGHEHSSLEEHLGQNHGESGEPNNFSGPVSNPDFETDSSSTNNRDVKDRDYNTQAVGFSDQDDGELRSPNRGGLLQPDVPPFAYDEYDSNSPLVYNDPALVGPSIGDPHLLEASNHPDYSVNNEKPKVFRHRNDGEAKADILEAVGSESGENVPHPVLQDRPLQRGSSSNEMPEAIYDVPSDDLDQGSQHPIPDVDYPAKETFSVDSSSSVDQDFPRFEDTKPGKYIPFNEEHPDAHSDGTSSGEVIPSNEDAMSSSKTPSQRIRERLVGAHRKRLQPSQMPSHQVPPNVNEEESPIETAQASVRSTRPPSRLESFQERFRQWKEKRQPTLPAEYQNLRPSRLPQTRRAPLTERNYELVRRRPQRVTSRRPVAEKPEEESLPTPQSDVLQPQNSQETNYKPPTIGQPITLPENVLPESEVVNNDENVLAENPRMNRLNQLRANRRRLQNRNRISNRRNRYQDTRLPNEGPPHENLPQEQIIDSKKQEESVPDHREMPSTNIVHQPPRAGENMNEDGIPAEDRFNIGDHNTENDRTDSTQDESEGYDQRRPGHYQEDPRGNLEGRIRGELVGNDREIHDHHNQDVSGNYDERYDGSSRGSYEENSRGDYDQNDREDYGENNRREYENSYRDSDESSRGEYDQSQQGEYNQNNREEYDKNNRGDYDQNSRGVYNDNNRGSYDQNDHAYYDQNNRRHYEPPSYRPQVQYNGPPGTHNYPRPESESQFDPPNDFRVSFPLPRNIGPSRPATYGHLEEESPVQDPIQVAESSRNNFQFSGHQQDQHGRHQVPAHPPRPALARRRNFQYREDAQVSDLRYDVPAVNQRPFRIYGSSPEDRRDPYSSSHPRPL